MAMNRKNVFARHSRYQKRLPQRFNVAGLGEVHVYHNAQRPPVASVGPYAGPAQCFPAPEPARGEDGRVMRQKGGVVFNLLHPYRGTYMLRLSFEGVVETLSGPTAERIAIGVAAEAEARLGMSPEEEYVLAAEPK